MSLAATCFRARSMRARTRAGRLACLDTWLLRREPALISGTDVPPLFVDVGFGERPVTTLETADALRSLHPALRVIGFELDESRARQAQQEYASEHVSFVRGGFHEVAVCEPKAGIVRVMNVLRSYSPEQVGAIHATLAEGLRDGGLLIEGTSDAAGHVLVAWLIRREAGVASKEALLLHTDFVRGFCPWLLRDFLPRDIRRGVHPGTPIHVLLSEWHAAWSVVRAQGVKSPRELFLRSLVSLATQRADVDPCIDLEPGFALWRVAVGKP
jgi:hypothetical protein